MRSSTDQGTEGRDQTAETLDHATEQVADTITDAARPGRSYDVGRRADAARRR